MCLNCSDRKLHKFPYRRISRQEAGEEGGGIPRTKRKLRALSLSSFIGVDAMFAVNCEITAEDSFEAL